MLDLFPSFKIEPDLVNSTESGYHATLAGSIGWLRICSFLCFPKISRNYQFCMSPNFPRVSQKEISQNTKLKIGVNFLRISRNETGNKYNQFLNYTCYRTYRRMLYYIQHIRYEPCYVHCTLYSMSFTPLHSPHLILLLLSFNLH